MDEGGDVPNKHGVERRSHEHADYRQPHLRRILGRKPSKTDAQHVREGFE